MDKDDLTDPVKIALQKWHMDTWDYLDSLSAKDQSLVQDWFVGYFGVSSFNYGNGYCSLQYYQKAFDLMRMHQIIMSAPELPVDCTVARGFQNPKDLEIGDEIVFQKPVSTSLSCRSAAKFNHYGCCQIQICLKKGQHALFLGPPHWPGGKKHPSFGKFSSGTFELEHEIVLAGMKVRVEKMSSVTWKDPWGLQDISNKRRICACVDFKIIVGLPLDAKALIIWDAVIQPTWSCQGSAVSIINGVPQNIDAILNGLKQKYPNQLALKVVSAPQPIKLLPLGSHVTPAQVGQTSVATSAFTVNMTVLADATPPQGGTAPPEGDDPAANVTTVSKPLISKRVLIAMIIVTAFLGVPPIILVIVMKKLDATKHYMLLKGLFISSLCLLGCAFIVTLVLLILHLKKITK